MATRKKRKPTAKQLAALRKANQKRKRQAQVKLGRKSKKLKQTGATNVAADRKRRAKKPGKRTSASGKTYYERRANRSDKSRVSRI